MAQLKQRAGLNSFNPASTLAQCCGLNTVYKQSESFNTKNLFILFDSRINGSCAKVKVRVGGPMICALFWDFTQRRFLVTDVSGKPIVPIFTARAVEEAIHVA
jgi:hypothetical protein